MLLPKFGFHAPKNLAEACEIMTEFGDAARVIAGGTDLMVNMKKGVVSPEQVVSLDCIEELCDIGQSDGKLTIGARQTVADLGASETIADTVPAMGAGARALGSPLIRNLATIGGNICTARPAADLPPSLIAYGAEVVVQKKNGQRRISLNEFFKGPGMTVLAPEEILTAVEIDIPGPGEGCGYINIGVRKAQDCNIVNLASYIALDPADGTIRKARVVMGSVGPTPLRAPQAEAYLTGEKPGEDLFEKAGEAASRDSSPILDFRGSAEYRRAMVGVLTRRTLAIALKQAQNGNA